METIYKDGYKITADTFTEGAGLFRSGNLMVNVTSEHFKGQTASNNVAPEGWADTETREYIIKELIRRFDYEAKRSFSRNTEPFKHIEYHLESTFNISRDEAQAHTYRLIDFFEDAYNERFKRFEGVLEKEQ